MLYLQQAWGERRSRAAGASAAAGEGAPGPGRLRTLGPRRLGLRRLGLSRLGLRTDVLALALPLVAVGGYFAYLRSRTGTWNAWQTAQDIGWHRGTAAPWTGVHNAWVSVQSAGAPDLMLSRWADLVVTLGGVALVVVLLALRRWPEAVFVLLNVAVLICSTTLVSAPRYALTWFPAYMLVAELAVRPRWRWLVPAIVVVCLPLLGVVALSFAAHRWTA